MKSGNSFRYFSVSWRSKLSKRCVKEKLFFYYFSGKCIKIFLNKHFSQEIFEHTVLKKGLFIILLYLGISSLCLTTHLRKSTNSIISFCKIKTIFKSSTRLAKRLKWLWNFYVFSGTFLFFFTIFLLCKDNFCQRFTFYKGFFIKIQKIREGPVQNETMLTWYKLLY